MYDLNLLQMFLPLSSVFDHCGDTEYIKIPKKICLGFMGDDKLTA